MQLRFSLAFLNLIIHSSSSFKRYIERYYKPLCVRNRVARETVPPPDLTTTQTTVLVATCKQRLMLSMLLGKATKAGKWVINLYSIAVKLWPRLYSNAGYPGVGGGWVTWVNFCWVCAACLSEPIPHYSLFLWPIVDPILVTFGKICNLRDPNLVTFYLRIYLINPLNRSS